MRRYFISVFVFVVVELSAQLMPADIEKVDAIFAKWNTRTSPGAALAIVRDSKLIYTRGYGIADLEHDVPISDSSIFYIGSVSKQFVAMCILLLEEQGKLKLDDPVQKFLPDFPTYNTTLTIRHFIHHTSGVRDNLTLWSLAGNDILDDVDKTEMYNMIKRQKALNFAPGEKFLYSNSCYFMLGLIIEKASGESLRNFADKNIFSPLGMRHTFFNDDNTGIIRNRAFSYFTQNGKPKNLIMRWDLVGSGGVYSNVKDLYLWDQNFYRNKLGKNGQALIDKMHVEGLLNDGKSSGYAFALVNGTYRGLRTVSHSGALAGYRSQLLRFPDQKTSIIILGNVIPIDVTALSYQVADVVLADKLAVATVVSQQSALSPSLPKNEISVENLKAYAGTFYSDELDVTYKVFDKENKLFYSIKNQDPILLRPTKSDVFESESGELEMTFERDKKKQIIGFSINAGRVTDLKFVKQ